jgi:hypothetical protein
MILINVFLLLLSGSVLCQQGVFDPYSFSQGSCTGLYQWTEWFDTNDPTPTQGDFEITKHIQQIFPSFMCLSPIAIEVLFISF